MYIVIVGAGDVGFFLGQTLVTDKQRILLIEKDPVRAKEVAQNSDIPVLCGDGSFSSVLSEARLDKADTFVALTPHDETNIISAQTAKEVFSVRRTVAKVNNPKNLKLFTCLGIDVPIDSTAILARIVEQESSFSDVLNLLSIKKGKLSIVRLDLPVKSAIVDKQIKNLKLPNDTVLVSILRGGDVIIPKGDTKLSFRDELIAITPIEREKELINYFMAKN
jgi:trk system potassium uptake protein